MNNKTLNTILFLLIATVTNIIIMSAIFIIPLTIIAAVFRESVKDFIGIIVMVLFAAAFIGGFFIYNLLLNFVRTKIDLEKYIHPILSGKKK
jgi:hypothetical protein